MGWAGARRRRDEPGERPQPQRASASRGAATPRSAQDAKRRFDQIVASSPTDRCASGWQRCRRGSTTASTSRGASPGGATRSSVPSARSTPPAPQPSSPSWRPLGDAHRRRRRPRRSSRCEAQLAVGRAARRRSPTRSRDRLRLLDARFDELSPGPSRCSVGTGDTEVLGHDVDQLVSELESLRVAMEETDKRPACRRSNLAAAPRGTVSTGSTEVAASSERSALARLEDLGDYLDQHREVVAVPESTTTGIERSGEGAALLRSNLIVASGTALSRITGLLRVMVFGYVIGKGALADVYLIGNETPNIVYELLIGGVLSATLVPLFTEFLRARRRAGDQRRDHRLAGGDGRAHRRRRARRPVDLRAVHGQHPRGRRPRADPAGRHAAHAGLPAADLLLRRRRRWPTPCSTPGDGSSPRRGARSSPTSSSSSRCCRCPTRTWQLADVETDDRLRWTLAVGSTVGIAAMALVLIPAFARRPGCASGRSSELRHPAIRRLLTMSLWTFGYVLCNQVVIIVVRNLSRPGPVARRPTSRRSRSSSSPTACWRCRSPRRSCPRWPERSGDVTARRSARRRRSVCG